LLVVAVGIEGVLWERRRRGHGLVFSDRFAKDNYNAVVLARSGRRQSYLAKLDLLRHLYRGVEVAVVDPEDEYRRSPTPSAGRTSPLASRGCISTPFDLRNRPDARVRGGLFLHSLVPVLFGEALSPAAKAALDRGIVASYESAASPRTRAPGSGALR